jgi:CheY-like chemotaxis protein
MAWQVLIVEDDADVRESLAEVLDARGYHTLTAGDGREALSLIRAAGVKPSVVLLDLMMPVMDGYEFLEIQAEDPWLAQVPVVLVTAQRPARKLAYSSVRRVVEKPLDLRALLAVVRDVCDETRPPRNEAS